jgi:hypothetical protein
MVKQRFLTHFKPWLGAVIRVAGAIAGYQLVDQFRIDFQYPPLDIVDVVVAAAVALSIIGLLCMVRAWGEWCWFKVRRLRTSSSELKRVFSNARGPRRVANSQALTGRMV